MSLRTHNYRHLTRTLLGTLLVVLPVGVASAQCTDFSNDIEQVGTLLETACGHIEEHGDVEDVDSAEDLGAFACHIWEGLEEAGIPQAAQNLWNALASNGSLTMGSRTLSDGLAENGDLVQGTKRTFIISDIIDSDFEIQINHDAGRADLEVSVCRIDMDDTREIIANYSDASQSGLTRTVPADGIGMYAILLKARSTGMGVQHYNYSITVNVQNMEPPPKRKYKRIDLDKVGDKAGTRGLLKRN